MKKYCPSKFEIRCSIFCGSRGFTLIEIMLVVVIVLILAGVAVPKFKGTLKSAQMTDASRSTVRMVRYARNLAILKQQPCTLRFSKDRLLLFCGTNSTQPEAARSLPEDITIQSFKLLSGDDKAGPEREVSFYAGGMNDGFELDLAAGERRARISCHPITGTVRVEDQY